MTYTGRICDLFPERTKLPDHGRATGRGRFKMSIEVRGTVYESAEAAAEALGVKTESVYSALNRGRIEYLGLGPGHYPRK